MFQNYTHTHTHTHTHTCTQPAEKVLTHVERGYRMDAPDGCPDGMYQIMKSCWDKDASLRPNFARIENMVVNEYSIYAAS